MTGLDALTERERYIVWMGEVLRQNAATIGKLRCIPHLRLPVTVDIAPIWQEIRRIGELPLQKLYSNDFPEDYYRDAWHVRSIFHTSADSMDTRETSLANQGSGYNDDGSKRYVITDLGEQMPQTVSTLQQFGPHPGRSRVSRVSAGKTVYWHSHCNAKNFQAKAFPTFVILHIPVTSNPRVSYEVRRIGDNEGPVWRQQYQPGEVWILNNWHEHQVRNLGHTDRYSVFTYFNLDQEPLRSLLTQAIAEYDGPLIPDAD